MKTLLIAASVFALSSPAFAQMEPNSPTTSQQTPPADATATGTTTAAQPAPSAPATPADAKVLIASEFPSYDKDSDGALNKTEFSAWMTALKARSNEKQMTPSEMSVWLNSAFKSADKDTSASVNLAELQSYLTAGA